MKGTIMSDHPDWIPSFLELADSGGDWAHYLDQIYRRFCDDLVYQKAHVMGRPVGVRRIPETDGKGFGFWHCMSTGKKEEERIPDLDRCRRVGWIRAVIENCDAPEVDHWTNTRGRETCHLLWYNEEYLIVLAERVRQRDGRAYFLLKTAYCTPGCSRKRNLRKERNANKMADAAPEDGV